MKRPFANVEDTLIAHHAYASHLPQRLDHVVSEYCDAAPWKVENGKRGNEEKGLALHDKLTAEELVLYNAKDCQLTTRAWERMQDDLAPERAVYEHDMRIAAICRKMIVAGIHVDTKRREELLEACRRRSAALKGRMRYILRKPSFQPSKVHDVRHALFHTLRARAYAVTPGGLPSTNTTTLEILRSTNTRAGEIADLLLQWRVCAKIRSTYLVAARVGADGRAHYNWKSFGTVSGRFASRLQSCPRWAPGSPEERVREIYDAAPGCEFVYYDASQVEMRLAAYLSADPTFIAACAGDVHANNAKHLFPAIAAKGWLDGAAAKDPQRGKPYRDVTKNIGFAISYYADTATAFAYLRSKGFDVSFREVELIMARLHSAYRAYFRFVERNHERVKQTGHMRGLRGRIRWFGWYPKITDVANYPVQEACAAIMNERTIELDETLPPGARLVAQVHDACIYEVPRRLVRRVKARIAEVWAAPVTLPGGDLVLPIDLKTGQRWSEL